MIYVIDPGSRTVVWASDKYNSCSWIWVAEMIDCDSEDEEKLARGHGRPLRIDQERRLSENMSEETKNRCGQVPRSDIEPCLYTHTPSPICQLPADVLCFILELYCQVELPVNFPLWSKPFQFIASQVCSSWRQIILDNPIFWNKIRVVFHGDCTCYYKMVEVPRLWLSRAKDLPCFIDFDFILPFLTLPHHHPLWRHDINKSIVRDLIAPHKCKGLGVIFADYHLHDLLELPDEKLSCIEILRLYHVHDNDNHETISLLDFHKLTNLTSFSLDAIVLHRLGLVPDTEDKSSPIFCSIPWHQLRHIHLDTSLPVLRCLAILETSSSVLETCSLVVSEDPSFKTSLISQIMPIHCQQLRKFKVYIRPSMTVDAGDSFLLLLRLPKLKSLTLQYPTWYLEVASIDLQALFRMWSVCTMQLEKLIICGLMCNVDAGALLASMPSLRCLELPKHSIFTVDAIRELGTGSIGPFLEELTIKKSEIRDEIGELLQMVQMRSCTKIENNAPKIKPTPLKYVLFYCNDPDGSLEQKYDATVDEINRLGVKLTVKFLDSELEGDGW